MPSEQTLHPPAIGYRFAGVPTAPPEHASWIASAVAHMGGRVEIEDCFSGILSRCCMPDGRCFRVAGHRLPLNDAVAAEVASDKSLFYLLLEAAGLPVPRGSYAIRLAPWCERRGLPHLLEVAAMLGYPVIVKPARGSRARHVYFAEGDDDLCAAVEAIHAGGEWVVIVQEVCHGESWRLLVLDGEVLLAYERQPTCLTGDGARDLLTLLAEATVAQGSSESPFTRSERELRSFLAAAGQPAERVLASGETLTLDGPLRGGSCGGRPRLLGETEVERCRGLASRVAALTGLRWLGLDLVAAADGRLRVLEANAYPGMDSLIRAALDEIVLRVYERVVRACWESAA
jgi:hypothetical protein